MTTIQESMNHKIIGDKINDLELLKNPYSANDHYIGVNVS